jgi:hypothetical protein
MEKNESSCSILRSLNLDNIDKVVSEAYHQEGAGRPPRKPIGMFKALIVKRVKQFALCFPCNPKKRTLCSKLQKAYCLESKRASLLLNRFLPVYFFLSCEHGDASGFFRSVQP